MDKSNEKRPSGHVACISLYIQYSFGNQIIYEQAIEMLARLVTSQQQGLLVEQSFSSGIGRHGSSLLIYLKRTLKKIINIINIRIILIQEGTPLLYVRHTVKEHQNKMATSNRGKF